MIQNLFLVILVLCGVGSLEAKELVPAGTIIAPDHGCAGSAGGSEPDNG
jgi:hypothetical protein